MKYVLSIVVVTLMCVASALGLAGRSGCQDPSEVGQTYPHHFDPTHYWYCEALGVPAVERECQKDFAYMHYLRECIPWASWIWKQPENPPSLAN